MGTLQRFMIYSVPTVVVITTFICYYKPIGGYLVTSVILVQFYPNYMQRTLFQLKNCQSYSILKKIHHNHVRKAFKMLLSTWKNIFFNLSVVELCILHYNGPVSVQHRIYIICKRMHRRKSITVQYSASSMLKANLFWDQFGLYIGLEIIFYEQLCEMSTFRNPENDHISAKWPTNLRALYFLELQKNKAISLNYGIILVSKP